MSGGGEPDVFLTRSLLAAGVGGWEWDCDLDVFRWTPETAGLLAAAVDRAPQGLQGFLAYVHPADRVELERTLRSSLAEGSRFRTQFRISDPGADPVALSAGSGGAVGSGGDVRSGGDVGSGGDVDSEPGTDPGRGRSEVLAGQTVRDTTDGQRAPGRTAYEAAADDGSRMVRMVGAPDRSGGPESAGGARRLAGVLEDVTDATRARRALTQTQHLASLGQLAAGIAHDFNNILTVVTMRADMLRSGARSASAAEFEEDAGAILEAAERASALTRQLMLFAGHQGARPVELDVAEVVTGLIPLVEAMREDVFVTEFDLEPSAPVSTDRAQLEQIVLNLTLNARDALREVPHPAGRPLVLRLRVREVPPGAAELGARRDQLRAGHPWVVLEVTDTGAGMDAETFARARDPFFTTKPVGVGTGLGLSVVHGLAEKLGGWLAIDSERNAGTTVRVVLPAAARVSPASAAPAGRRPNPDAAATAAPRQLIVVTDDDDAVRSVTSRSLKLHGFDVLQAGDAREALETLEAHPDVIALVSDIVMPGMSGTELAARVLTEHPRIPVLLVTGYAPPNGLVSSPRLAVVTKPLTGARLAESLRELLSRVEVDAG